MRFISAVVLAAAAILVNAQSETSSSAVPTGTAGLDDCILNCVSTAATSAGCSSFADLSCVCTSQQFQSEALSCLQSNCSADDLATAQALQQSQCAAVSGVSSLSSAATSVISSLSSEASSLQSSLSSRLSSFTAGTQTGTVTAATGSSTGSSTDNAALGLKGAFAPGAALSAAVGVVGLAFGALLV